MDQERGEPGTGKRWGYKPGIRKLYLGHDAMKPNPKKIEALGPRFFDSVKLGEKGRRRRARFPDRGASPVPSP